MCRGTGGLTQLKEIELSNNLEMIGDFFFYGCKNIASIKIPSSLTSIGDQAFNSCTNLTTIYYSGSATVPSNKWGAPNATVISE